MNRTRSTLLNEGLMDEGVLLRRRPSAKAFPGDGARARSVFRPDGERSA